MIAELSSIEARQVAGGSIAQDIEDTYPGGEWYGHSYFPNGLPGGGGAGGPGWVPPVW